MDSELDKPQIIIPPEVEPITDPVPAPVPGANGGKERRNQHLKIEEPKNKQFTGRATEREYERINRALQARKREGQAYDIVRLCLDMLNHIESDIFQTFRTK